MGALSEMSGELLHDRYQIQQSLGKKAGRQTFLALDLQTQKPVVVKLLTFGHDFEWADLKLFEREAETLKALDHPAIPRYLDYFEMEWSNGKGFALVQSYIEAKSLQDQLTAGRTFSEIEVQQLAKSLLEILAYLHRQHPPVIHRDIKPSNLLLTDRSGNHVGQVYLVDFGSVQTLVAQEGGTITVVGTYGYMPPEQYGGRATPASDLYSLGATLIYLVTGKHPADLPQRNLRIQFRSVAHVSPEFADWLTWLTEPALDERLESTEEALDILQNGYSQPSDDLMTVEEGKIAPPLTFDRILWNAVWRTTGIGFISLLANSTTGLFIGFLNGLLVGLLTYQFYFPLSRRGYSLKLGSAVVVLTSLLLLVGNGWSPEMLISRDSMIFNLMMVGASQLFARWYIRQSQDERSK
ncbi:serine/threonine protein kinase [Phormidesmis sp. 146-33]